MATNCYGRRRLRELLQEQQEPFLVHHGGGAPLQCRWVAEACGRRLRGLCCDYRGGAGRERRGVGVGNGDAKQTKSMLCGVKAVVRKALLCDLAACFSCAGGRDRFRRLPRSVDVGGEDDGGTQLSPVSVLQLRSDEESTELISHWDEEEDDSKPSTSAISPSSSSGHHPGDDSASPRRSTFYTHSGGATVHSMEEGDHSKFQTTKMMEEESSIAKTEQQAIIVSAFWERIAAEISRISKLVEIDLSGGSAQEWRHRRIGKEEARRVGESIEAMIFEEVRWEAVRDMLCS